MIDPGRSPRENTLFSVFVWVISPLMARGPGTILHKTYIMKRLVVLTVFISFLISNLTAQSKMAPYINNTYVFAGYVQLKACDNLGANASNVPTTAPNGTLFTVANVTEGNDLVIVFLTFKIPPKGKDNDEKAVKHQLALKNRAIYNFKTNAEKGVRSMVNTDDNIQFFLLTKADFDAYCALFVKTARWSLTFGSSTTPFKFRSHPSLFTTNLNLGANVSLQYKIGKDFSVGAIAGISLSSVTLDSFSTKGVVMTSTDRPAVTPTADLIFGYKNINLIVGFGWDIVNRTTALENSWIYNGSRWVGLGIGISLFNPSTTTSSPGTSGAQKD